MSPYVPAPSLAALLALAIHVPVVPCTADPGPLAGSSSRPDGAAAAPALPRAADGVHAEPPESGWTSEAALLGAVVVDGRERRVATVRDLVFERRTGEVLHLLAELSAEPAGEGRSLRVLARADVQWQPEHQRLATQLDAGQLARLPAFEPGDPLPHPAAPTAGPPSPGDGGALAAPAPPGRGGFGPAAPRGPQREAWLASSVCGARPVARRGAPLVRGLVLDPAARRVVAVTLAAGPGEDGQGIPVPPGALGRDGEGNLYSLHGSRALSGAPRVPGSPPEAFADPAFRAPWQAYWAAFEPTHTR